MCGIAGWLTDALVEAPRVRKVLQKLEHRGPDGHGVWTESLEGNRKVGLLHTRLAIIDLSKDGAQPMQSSCGQVILSFNGEIYNYRELRAELENKGRVFHSQSDTEVLLQAYQEWGNGVFTRLVGMFSVALIDKKHSIMLLARDPFGIKPLYYSINSRGIWFSSEIRALIELSETIPKMDLQVVHDYLALGHVDQSPRTFFDGIQTYLLTPL